MTAKGLHVPHHPIGSDQLTAAGVGGPTAFDAEPLYAAARAHRAMSRARCRTRSGVALSVVGALATTLAVLMMVL